MNLAEKAINLQNLREHNVDIITNLLSEKPMSCLELAYKINISDVAVNKIIKQLRAINMVVQNADTENKRKKGSAKLIESLKVNDNVMTAGGVIGKIVSLDDDTVVIETSSDRTKIKFSKNSILKLMNAKEN